MPGGVFVETGEMEFSFLSGKDCQIGFARGHKCLLFAKMKPERMVATAGNAIAELRDRKSDCARWQIKMFGLELNPAPCGFCKGWFYYWIRSFVFKRLVLILTGLEICKP